MADKLQSDLHFAIVPRWIVRHPDLTAQAVRVYAVLADHADKQGRAFPSRRTIGNEAGGIEVATVARALKLLLEHGALTSEQQSGGVTLYTIHRIPVSRVTQGRITDESAPRITGDTQKKTQLKKNHKDSAYQKIYAEFVVLFGAPTGDMRGRYGKAAKAAVSDGIASGELRAARNRYAEVWPNVSCNPQALINNWNRFGPKKSRVVVEVVEEPVEVADPSLVRSLVEGFRS